MKWMRRAVLLLPLLAGSSAWAGPPVGETFPPWFKASLLDLREDVTEARQGGRRLLLFFYQEGCTYCARMVADDFGQPAIAEKARAGFDVVTIDIRGVREVTDLNGAVTTERRFAEGMRVRFTPTLLFLDEQGHRVARLDGYYPPERFDRALDYAAGRAGQGIYFSDYMRQAGAAAK